MHRVNSNSRSTDVSQISGSQQSQQVRSNFATSRNWVQLLYRCIIWEATILRGSWLMPHQRGRSSLSGCSEFWTSRPRIFRRKYRDWTTEFNFETKGNIIKLFYFNSKFCRIFLFLIQIATYKSSRDFQLSYGFFNIIMQRIIYAAGLRHSGTIFNKSDREAAVAFSKFAEEARSIGLAVNGSKTK